MTTEYSTTGEGDDSNRLVLEPKKKKPKTGGSNLDGRGRLIVDQKKKKLSKKQRQRRERAVEKRKKLSQRDAVLEELQKFQIPAEELQQLSSFAKIKQKVQQRAISVPSLPPDGPRKLNSIRGSAYSLAANKSSVDVEADQDKPLSAYLSESEDEDEDEEEEGGVPEPANPDRTIDEIEEESTEPPILVDIKEDHQGGDDADEQKPSTSSRSSNEEKAAKRQKQEVENDGTKEGSDTEKSKSSNEKNEKGKSAAAAAAGGINRRKSKPVVHVPVHREEKVQAQRMKLPVLAEEQAIVEAINDNPVVILCGETGSGKTTQVPQFLYEAGYAENGRLIGITEPRRVAAVSMSKRVGMEMNLDSDIVSYHIRYEGNTTEKTKIKFMTDGVLMKELQRDIRLTRYSVIIIDEAHERSMYSDILIGLLSRIVPLRAKLGDPLKLVIMSATLRLDDFTQPHLFCQKPAIINVEARQFPVTIHFNRRTPDDYLTEAFRKVHKIHRSLPEGGILVFVSGQREVETLIRRLKHAFPIINTSASANWQGSSPRRRQSANKGKPISSAAFDDSYKNDLSAEEPPAGGKKGKKRKKRDDSASKTTTTKIEDMQTVNLDSYGGSKDDTSCRPEGTEEKSEEAGNQSEELSKSLKQTKLEDQQLMKVDLDECGAGDDAIGDVHEGDGEGGGDDNWLNEWSSTEEGPPCDPLYCLPLFSLLPTSKQTRVFQPVPDGHRLCVIATNVAETSLTIPGIRYVVDLGKEKVRLFDPITGVSQFVVQWVSKASADQRAGRAGRVGPGHTYRLYSSAVFGDFNEFPVSEILNKPVEELTLQMKAMNIVKVVNFPFITAPAADALLAADDRLVKLGALKMDNSGGKGAAKDGLSRISELGKTINLFPVKPEYGKILALSEQSGVLPYAVTLVSAMSVREPLINLSSLAGDKPRLIQCLNFRRRWADSGESLMLGDLSVLLKAVGSAEFQGLTQKFCNDHGLRFKAMMEIRKLRNQLTNLINGLCQLRRPLVIDPNLQPPSDTQCALLRQILAAGLPQNVARRIEADAHGNRLKGAYQTMLMTDFVYLNPSSVLYKNQPDWLLYQEVIAGSQPSADGGLPRKFLQTVCEIDPEWLPIMAKSYCTFTTSAALTTTTASEAKSKSKVIDSSLPFYDADKDQIMVYAKATYGPQMWLIANRTPIELDDQERTLEKYQYFAKSLLEGSVIPGGFREWRLKLLAQPAVLTKSWSQNHMRIREFLTVLVEAGISTRKALTERWAIESRFLLPQFLLWLPESYHSTVTPNWPPSPSSDD